MKIDENTDTLGLRLISSLLDEQDFQKVDDVLEETDFLPQARTPLRFIRNYVLENNEWPGPTTVEGECLVKLPKPRDGLESLVELVRKRKVRKAISGEGNRIQELLDKGEVDAAYRRLISAGDRLSLKPKSNLITFSESRDDRYQEYLETKNKEHGFEGMLSPWGQLNDRIQGYVNSEYVIFAAKTNTGKTWACLINANHCLNQKGRVLVASLEMTRSQVMRRLDAVRYRTPYYDLKRATLPPLQEDEFRRKLDEDKTVEGEIVFADVNDIQYPHDVAEIVRRRDIDIVILDGMYRLKNENKKADGYNALRETSIELQRLAQVTNIPWIGTTQMGGADEKGAKSKIGQEMNLWNTRWARDIMMDASVGIGLQSNAEQRLMGLIEIHVMKNREHDKSFDQNWFLCNWDLQTMTFDETSNPLEFGEAVGDGDLDF